MKSGFNFALRRFLALFFIGMEQDHISAIDQDVEDPNPAGLDLPQFALNLSQVNQRGLEAVLLKIFKIRFNVGPERYRKGVDEFLNLRKRPNDPREL